MGLKEDVVAMICKTLDVAPDEVEEKKKLYDSVGVDSTEMVELTISLGKHFGVKIQPNEITKFSTPEEIAGIIAKKKNAA